MTLAVDTLTLLAEGVAQHLAAEADPALNVTWRDGSIYQPGELAISLVKVPTDPDRVIVLSPRQLTADPTLADAEYALQMRYRGDVGDPRSVWGIRDACRAVMLGRWPVQLPNGLTLSVVEFAGGTGLGEDPSHRWEWSDNLTMRLGEYRARPF